MRKPGSKNAICCLLFCLFTAEAGAWGTAAWWTTHKTIAHDAITNVDTSAEYPDVTRFHDDIRDGAGFESHDLPDNNNTQWWGNGIGPAPRTWFSAGLTPDGQEGALSLYTKYQFKAAYTRIGYELHCSQDEFVPAHIRYCQHGTWYLGTIRFDDLEWYAQGNHVYSTTAVAWTHLFTHSAGSSSFEYWLDDSMDDDDRDESGSDADDEGPPTTNPIKDIAVTGWGIAETDWGTYGQPNYHYNIWLQKVLVEYVPGRDEGLDEFGKYLPGNVGVIHRQLQLSLDDSCSRLISDSTNLPPLVPDDTTHGQPSISAKIFGPNMPIDISFVAMENRQKTIWVSILAGTVAIKTVSGTVLDGGGTSGYNLLSNPSPTALPWHGTIVGTWKGDLGTGQLADGSYTIKMKVRDQDGNDSEERTRSVKYDKTKPTGTITVNVLP